MKNYTSLAAISSAEVSTLQNAGKNLLSYGISVNWDKEKVNWKVDSSNGFDKLVKAIGRNTLSLNLVKSLQDEGETFDSLSGNLFISFVPVMSNGKLYRWNGYLTNVKPDVYFRPDATTAYTRGSGAGDYKGGATEAMAAALEDSSTQKEYMGKQAKQMNTTMSTLAGTMASIAAALGK